MRRQALYILTFVALFLAVGVGVSTASFAQEGGDGVNQVKVSTEDFGDWMVRCNNGVDGVDKGKKKRGRCEMSQSLSQKDSKQRVAEFNIGFPSNEAGAVGVVILPLGLMLQHGGQLQIDEQDPLSFKFRSCEPGGCFALIVLDDALIKDMRKGGSAYISFMLPNQKIMRLPFSLRGFTKAFNNISK